jgi:hypothetical protein
MKRTTRILGVLAAFAVVLVAAFSVNITAANAYPGGGGTATVTSPDTNPTPGSTIAVTGSGFDANESVDGTLHSAPIDLGTETADSTGVVHFEVAIPSTFTGTHTITLAGLTSGFVATLSIVVSATPTATSGGGGLASTGAAVIGMVVLAAVLLVGGGILLTAGRRRTSSLV